MTRSIFASSLITIALIVVFAVPAYADHTDYDYWQDGQYDSWRYNQDHDWNYGRSGDWDDDRIPSCEISVSPNTTGPGGPVRLTWESDYADYADITDFGRVGPDGSRAFAAYASKTYRMVVYNNGKSAECSTFVNILGDQYRGGYGAYYPYQQLGYRYYGGGQPSCTITIAQAPGGQQYLSWTSYNAQSAYLSNHGTVPANGSQMIYGGYSGYTLTVNGPGGSNTCSTGAQQAYPYAYSAANPYLSLSQIPYTGFDFGPFGNALYWVALILLALGGAYILVYQQGYRVLATVPVLGDTLRAGKMQYAAMRGVFLGKKESAPITVPTSLPVAPEKVVKTDELSNDAMARVEGDRPHIVITRE